MGWHGAALGQDAPSWAAGLPPHDSRTMKRVA